MNERMNVIQLRHRAASSSGTVNAPTTPEQPPGSARTLSRINSRGQQTTIKSRDRYGVVRSVTQSANGTGTSYTVKRDGGNQPDIVAHEDDVCMRDGKPQKLAENEIVMFDIRDMGDGSEIAVNVSGEPIRPVSDSR